MFKFELKKKFYYSYLDCYLCKMKIQINSEMKMKFEILCLRAFYWPSVRKVDK